MNNKTLVISFGNYEIKILVGVREGKNAIPLFTSSFSARGLILNSFIIDKDEIQKKLSKIFQEILEKFGEYPLNVVYNIPLDNLIIKEQKSDLYIVKEKLSYENWNQIYSKINSYNKKLFFLGKKVKNWMIDGITYNSLPEGKTGELSFNIQFFLIPKIDINCYLDLFNELEFNNYQIVTDEIVMANALNKEYLFEQVIVNIGDLKTTISLYYNHSLIIIIDYDFGIKKLTSKISEITEVDENEAIEILKNYHNYFLFNKNINESEEKIKINDLPLAIKFNLGIGQYLKFNLEMLNKIIKEWVLELADIINNFSFQIERQTYEIEEISILTVTNIFEYWIKFLEENLDLTAVCKIIKNSNDLLLEKKYISLIYCI
ncbi:MAG: hypothetical protein ACRDCG_02115 [Mycoplasmoidaceae bacterium]